ncbi:hypothetical protein [Crystallibacter degradans]|nr:hypothetical protein [Arthrobacter sp. SF27]
MMPTADDLRAVADHVLDHLARLQDSAWEQPAHQLEWSCRDSS